MCRLAAPLSLSALDQSLAGKPSLRLSHWPGQHGGCVTHAGCLSYSHLMFPYAFGSGGLVAWAGYCLALPSALYGSALGSELKVFYVHF